MVKYRYFYRTIVQQFNESKGEYEASVVGELDCMTETLITYLRDNFSWAKTDRRKMFTVDDIANVMGAIGWRLVTYNREGGCFMYTFEKTKNESDDEL